MLIQLIYDRYSLFFQILAEEVSGSPGPPKRGALGGKSYLHQFWIHMSGLEATSSSRWKLLQYCCVDFLYYSRLSIAIQTECWIWLTFPNKTQDLWAIFFCTGKKANNRWFWNGSLCKREWKSCTFPLYQQQYISHSKIWWYYDKHVDLVYKE